jgi:hypothetical protein
MVSLYCNAYTREWKLFDVNETWKFSTRDLERVEWMSMRCPIENVERSEVV